MRSKPFSVVHVRRSSAGMAFCLIATIAVVMLAWQDNRTSILPVIYELQPQEVVATSLFQVTDVSSVRGRQYQQSGARARTELVRFSESGHSRHLRYAKLILSSSTLQQKEPLEYALIQSRILQAEHKFVEAAELLRPALDKSPSSIEGWLLLSDTLRRAGLVGEARKACLNTALAGNLELAQWCAIQVSQSAGEASRAYKASQQLLGSIHRLPEESRSWAHSIAADAAAGAGFPEQAIDYMKTAMASGRTSLAARLTTADMMIESGRYAEVAGLLRNDSNHISAQVRLALSETALGEGPSVGLIEQIEAEFAVADAISDDLRLRDRAIWELHFNGNSRKALDYALANWQLQKGSEDILLLRVAAKVAGDNKTLDMLNAWQASAAARITS